MKIIKKIIESEKIIFLETDINDIEKIISIEKDKDNKEYIFSWSKERHNEAIKNSEEMHITIKSKTDDEIIGYVLLSSIGDINGSIEFRRIAISKKGRGYGRDSIKLIKKLSFEIQKCHRLWLDVYDDNYKALNLYLSENFRIEGVLRESRKYKNGYKSMIVMSILETEYSNDIK